MKPIVVGICGGSASGKTHAIRRWKAALGLPSVVFELDRYYKPRSEQQTDALGYKNFDLPEALDLEKMEEDWHQLLQGQSIQQPLYTYNHKEEVRMETLFPQPVIWVDGIFTFHLDFIDDALDLRIWLDAPFEQKKERRLQRDTAERGYTAMEILYRFTVHAEESYIQYVLPYKGYADFHLDTENSNELEDTAILDRIYLLQGLNK